MARTRRAVGWLVALVVLTGSLVGLVDLPASASGGGTSTMLSAVNSARANAGRRPLSLRSDLSSVALSWSQRMAARNVLSHNPSLTSQVTGWRWVGENVGYGPDVATVQAAFMGSPAHRANILDSDYSQIGIGIVYKGDRVWVTQVFRAPLGSSSSATSGGGTSSAPTSSTRGGTTSTPSSARRTTSTPDTAPVKRVPTAAERLAHRLATTRSRPAGKAGTGDPLARAVNFTDVMRSLAG